MIGDCPYWLQIVFWIVVMSLGGTGLRLVVEAITRGPRRKDLPWW